MSKDQTNREATIASPEVRVERLQHAIGELGVVSDDFAERFREKVEQEWSDRNGAKVVARAWVDPDFKRRLMADGLAAIADLGLRFPEHQRHLVVLENTAAVHNVIVCTLCSCTAVTLIGVAPGWYKDLPYRARVVKETRSVLAEMGLALAPDIELRVWDTTADTRYMVLPHRPAFTAGWSERQLIDLVTQESLIGVERLETRRAD